ncbi:uncharacterized protein LOC111010590 isoform X2 [Momordica charantia]|uniref:Uncharacterized protein LOC111010590 isoform X2 n=1 Tax=Momordica charantia TaxID=3673 RepID=A0A6J1CEV3_MOMCH|nr:uncharacterized protein LOC111010590 isoform X2 [Momordica charantia]
MAYCDAPSFSLGLDLDFDSEPQIPIPDCTARKPASDCSVGASASSKEDDCGEVGTGVVGCTAEIENEPPRKFKRLKRGPSGGSSLAMKNESLPSLSVVDEDIEEFSSQEDFPRDHHPSSLLQCVCSTSKVPLHGILTAPSSSQLKAKKIKETVDAPTSAGLEKQNKSMFSNLTISPLRKFQLLDSDSDDPSSCDNKSRKSHKAASSLDKQKSIFCHSATAHYKKMRLTACVTQKEDLWKDFCQTKSSHLPTPAFDEVCEEFFQLKKDNKAATELGSSARINCMDNQTNNSSCPNELMDKLSCPAHYYFFHDDPRIQKLVRNRLPNFFPLGVDGSRASVIDYMRQFNNGEASTCRPSQVNVEKSSKRSTDVSKGSKNIASKSRVNKKVLSPLSSKKAPKRVSTQKNNIGNSSRNVKGKQGASNCEELLKDSGSWIDPKSSFSLPRDAGKRRVQAGGQSSTGHWYTSPEGKKVYITKSGEELTGRAAYRFYKKDTGGFRKSKKKVASKKRKG